MPSPFPFATHSCAALLLSSRPCRHPNNAREEAAAADENEITHSWNSARVLLPRELGENRKRRNDFLLIFQLAAQRNEAVCHSGDPTPVFGSSSMSSLWKIKRRVTLRTGTWHARVHLISGMMLCVQGFNQG